MKKALKRSTALMMALLMIISATVLTALADGTENGFGQENGSWYYYQNSQVDTSRNDVIRGTVNGQDGWWYVVNGKVQLNYTGLANYANDYGWWYIKNGQVDFSHNGVDQNNYGWWYVTGGQVQFGYTGVADYANDYGWWYIRNGQVDFGKTGIEPNNYGWWRVVNGKVDFNCNSVEQNHYGWWYLVGGQVQFGYTGVADYANAYGWWYIRNGQVDFVHNGVDQNAYGWWYVTGGQVQFGYTGVANYANAYGWWYISGGQVDFTFSGVSSNNYGSWYVENGKVDFTAKIYDVNNLSQKQENMLAPISCLYMCAGTGPYNWSNLDLVWWAVSYMANRYPGMYCNIGYGPVTGDALKECWSAMFIDFDGNIPAMEEPGAGYNYSGCTYDGTYYYLGAFDGWGQTTLYFDAWVEHADGSCTVDVEVRVLDVPNVFVKEIDRVELVKNKYTESISDPTFVYTIASSERIG